MPLLDAIPAIKGRRGRPRFRPEQVQGDRAYQSEKYRQMILRRGMRPVIAKRRSEHGTGLGKSRWVIERTLAWLHQFRRLRVRYERWADVHEAFLSIACRLGKDRLDGIVVRAVGGQVAQPCSCGLGSVFNADDVVHAQISSIIMSPDCRTGINACCTHTWKTLS